MTAVLLDGRAIAATVEAEVAAQATEVTARAGLSPGLAAILVGEDPGSALYVRRKAEAAGRTGIRSETYHLSADVTEEAVLTLIDELNARPDVHGILPQQPMPPQISPARVFARLDPRKDVDGLGPDNLAALFAGRPNLLPCTPAGIMLLLRHAEIDPAGQEAVVIGRSLIVGKPTAVLLLQAHATVTWCHTRTRDLAAHTRRADILVAAAGRPGLVTGDMVKPGAAVIDVGISRVGGKLRGDVDFASVSEVAGWITPVPGGVGPMTIAMLLKNTVQAAAGLMRVPLTR